MSKESFKTFVKNNSSLIKYVNNNEMTWQKFYELYDLYGEDKEIWSKYLNSSNSDLPGNIKNIFDLFKGVDLKTVQKALVSLDKAIGTFRELNSDKDSTISPNYAERPKNRFYED